MTLHFASRWPDQRTKCDIDWKWMVHCVFFKHQVTCKRCLKKLEKKAK